jgi:hypothetical protein
VQETGSQRRKQPLPALGERRAAPHETDHREQSVNGNAHKRRQLSSATIPNALLERARQEDAAHRAVHQRPISADTLRRRLGIGAKRSRRLVALVRSEGQTPVTGDPAGLETVSKGSGAEPALVA